MLLSKNWVFVSKETPFYKKGYLLLASNPFFVETLEKLAISVGYIEDIEDIGDIDS